MDKNKEYPELTFDQENELIQHLVDNNPLGYNLDKALEETTEFNHVILQLKNKRKDNPNIPDRKEAIYEYGDMAFRGLIGVYALFPEMSLSQVQDEVEKHIGDKMSQLYTYFKEGKYQGGL